MIARKQVYVSENGDWGEADSLWFLDCDDWTEADYDAMHGFSWSQLMEYVGAALDDGGEFEGCTPSQWQGRRA